MPTKAEWITVTMQNPMIRSSAHQNWPCLPEQLEKDIAHEDSNAKDSGRLGSLLGALSEEYRHIEELDDAIAAIEAAVDAAPGTDADYLSWRRLHMALLRDEEVTIEQGNGKQKKKDWAQNAGHAPDRGDYLHCLAILLEIKFEQTWGMADLNRCIFWAEKAVALTPPDDTEYVRLLNHYAYWLNIRYEWTRTIDDLTASLMLTDVAVYITPDDDPDFPLWEANNAVQAYLYYLRFGGLEDLDKAVRLNEEAIHLTFPDHPDRPRRLSNLAHCLGSVEEYQPQKNPLQGAVEMAEDAVGATPPGHPDRSITLSHLGFLLQQRFNRFGGDKGDLDRAIQAVDAAGAAMPENSRARIRLLASLGELYHTRSRITGDPMDEALSAQCFVAGWNYDRGPPSIRVEMGSIAAAILGRSGVWEASCGLLTQCVDQLPNVAPRYLRDSDKAYLLSRFGSLGADAAASSLNAGKDPSHALQLLESSREIVSGNMWDWEIDISSLQDKQAELVQRFQELRHKLYLGTSRDWSSESTDSTSAHELRHLELYESHGQLQELATKIRQLGLEGFLQTPELTELLGAADPAPIVVISVSMWRSDALVVRTKSVTVVPLPQLHEHDVVNYAGMLDNAEGAGGRASVIPLILGWLWDVVAHPVLEELGYPARSDQQYNDWPRVCWVPTGMMARFPLHAAGRYPAGQPTTDTVLDRVVSTYAPSIRSLVHARRMHQQTRSHAAPPATDALIVAMPTTPGFPDSALPYALEESRIIKGLCHSLNLTPHAPDPTRDNILATLRHSAIFHYAGHGMIEANGGSAQSYLLLRDWMDWPLAMYDLQQLRRESRSRSFLAYLSACSTGKTAESALLNEAVHFMSFFQRAGFRHVIGTLWPVSDRTSVEMAWTVYQTLVEEGMVDGVVARALHRATRTLRDASNSGMAAASGERDPKQARSRNKKSARRNREFGWVPYFHYGI